MSTITKEALEWIQDELESKDEVITQLEEELISALEENVSLKAAVFRLRERDKVD